jgi:hypothetical protein
MISSGGIHADADADMALGKRHNRQVRRST